MLIPGPKPLPWVGRAIVDVCLAVPSGPTVSAHAGVGAGAGGHAGSPVGAKMPMTSRVDSQLTRVS